MPNRSVSIVIDNYNYARFLRQAIDSALAQAYRPLEVVVVDDGSTDDSAEIMRSYGDKICAVFKENGGQGSAFNAGFARSTGEIVALLDADDYLKPGAIEQLAAAYPSFALGKMQKPVVGLLILLAPRGVLRRIYPSMFPAKSA
jgi:glycosyltransferase involved in cell wall biosynthesis